MRKESQHYQQSQNINQSAKQQCQDNRKTVKKLAQIHSKTDFIQLLKSLPFEIRYLAVKVEVPGLPHAIKMALKKLQNKNDTLQTNKHPSKVSKIISESLVFVSDGRQYFDSICFEFNYIQHPEKLYDLLMNTHQNAKKFNPIQQMNKNRKPIADCIVQVNLCKTKQELLSTVIKIVRHEIFYNCCKKGQIQLNDQKNRKKQLSFHWKNLSQQSKKKILLLNKSNVNELCDYLFDLNINIKLEDLQKEFINLLDLEKNYFCNRILKCKLKKSLIPISDYHQLIYNVWKKDLERIKKKRNRKNNHLKQQQEKGPRESHHNMKSQNTKMTQESQKINVKYLQKHKSKKAKQSRQKSHSVDSFQTNETQIQCQLKFKRQNSFRSQQKKLQIQKLIEEQISNNIIQCSDLISTQANQFCQRRLIAYSRIQYVMGVYGIPIKLFGSCANGIAIKNSDIDIAFDNSITNYFNLCQEIERPKMALEWVADLFSNFGWVSNLKLIKNATVPILKLKVNTSVDIQAFFLNYQSNEESLEYLKNLNRNHNKGIIQVDITIETQSKTFECNHLGIKTTQQINEWLQSFKPLRHLTIILKNYLTNQGLNVTYQGGINTYVTIVMLVAGIYKLKLQHQERVNVFTEALLKFYAFQFDQTKYGIDIRNVQNPFYLKKIEQLNFKQAQYSRAELQVLDPLNNGKIMTKKCYNFSKIKQIFQKIHVQCFSKYRKSQQQIVAMNINNEKKKSINQKQFQTNEPQKLLQMISKETMCEQGQYSDFEQGSDKQKVNKNPFLLIFKQKSAQIEKYKHLN